MLTSAKCSNDKLGSKIDRIHKKATKILAIKLFLNIRSTILIARKVSDRISSKNKRDAVAIFTASFTSKLS